MTSWYKIKTWYDSEILSKPHGGYLYFTKAFPTSTYEEIIYGIDMPLELTSNLIHVTSTRSTKHPLRALIRGA